MTADAPADAIELTEDALLGGRVRLRQPARGFRAAIDTVLLAASVPAGEGERVLDLGAGAGGAALALAVRVAGVRVSGLEKDEAMARLCNENAGLNEMAGRVDCVAGSVSAPPTSLLPGTFDHVMMNPPYRDAGSGTPSPVPGRAQAGAHADGVGLADWVSTALSMVRPRGHVTIIYDAGGLDGLIAALSRGAGDIRIFPLWPSAGDKPAKRVIVRARKGAKSPAQMLPGLVLHEAGGDFTAVADAVLKGGRALEF